METRRIKAAIGSYLHLLYMYCRRMWNFEADITKAVVGLNTLVLFTKRELCKCNEKL